MIPQERIEQAAGDYRDELLKEKNRTTGQFVGIPPTHKEIEAMVIGYADGMTAGVRFAESEIGQISKEFAEWCGSDGWVQEVQANNWKNVLDHKVPALARYTTSDLFAKFMEERTNPTPDIEG